MVAYSFKTQFEGALRAGDKAQTIRALGKRRHARPRELVQVYVGMRTANCRLLFQSECLEVLPITIRRTSDPLNLQAMARDFIWEIRPIWEIRLNDNLLSLDEQNQLALADGFPDLQAFYDFFYPRQQRLPFEGVLIKWQTPPF